MNLRSGNKMVKTFQPRWTGPWEVLSPIPRVLQGENPGKSQRGRPHESSHTQQSQPQTGICSEGKCQDKISHAAYQESLSMHSTLTRKW